MQTQNKVKPITFNPSLETRQFLETVKINAEIGSMNNLLEIIFKAMQRKDYTKLERMTKDLSIN